MALTPEQRKVARAFARAVRDTNASPRITEALYEAGLVESGLRNLDHGDRDSVGALQQRASQGWKGLRNPYKAAREFIAHGQQLQARGFKGSSGSLAQAIQRSAFPDRYEQRNDEAEGLVRRFVGGQRGGSQAPSTRLVGGAESIGGFDPGGPSDLSALIRDQMAKPQRPTASGPAAPAFSAQVVSAAQPIQTSGPRQKAPSVDSLLASLAQAQQADLGASPQGSPGQQRSPSTGGSQHAQRGGLIADVQNIDQLAAKFGAPITARQEPGHAAGGDHDPAVKGATARDIGGSEAQRKAIFRRITRQLGIKNAVYKGPDINVTRGGVRYQIISRDHGTGPHLHVGLRRVK